MEKFNISKPVAFQAYQIMTQDTLQMTEKLKQLQQRHLYKPFPSLV